MEEALVETRRRRRRRRKACKDVTRIIVSIVVMAMLIWMVSKGYNLATYGRRDAQIRGCEDGYIALVFGVLTVVSGLVYFIIGLTVVAELALGFLANNNQEKEQRRIWHVMIWASATMVSVVMLTWATYHGSKLASDVQKGGVHSCLTFLIGFIAMAFGLVYFIIGASIVAESALHLSGRLQQKGTESSICQEGKTDAVLVV